MLNKLIKTMFLLLQNITEIFTSLLTDNTLNLMSMFLAKIYPEVITFIFNNNVNVCKYKCVNVNVNMLHFEGVNYFCLFSPKQ